MSNRIFGSASLPWRTKLRVVGIIVFSVSFANAFALDKHGNFESKQEQDAFIVATLRKMAGDLNSQTPVQLDEDMRMMSVIALQKTITFYMRLPNFKASDIEPNRYLRLSERI